MINAILIILEAIGLFVAIIFLAGLIGKLAGKSFDNDPR